MWAEWNTTHKLFLFYFLIFYFRFYQIYPLPPPHKVATRASVLNQIKNFHLLKWKYLSRRAVKRKRLSRLAVWWKYLYTRAVIWKYLSRRAVKWKYLSRRAVKWKFLSRKAVKWKYKFKTVVKWKYLSRRTVKWKYLSRRAVKSVEVVAGWRLEWLLKDLDLSLELKPCLSGEQRRNGLGEQPQQILIFS